MVSKKDEFLGRIGLVDENLPNSYAEDYEWALRAARVSPIVAVRNPLVDVYWLPSSFYAQEWRTKIAAWHYLLDKYPEFQEAPQGVARLYGRLAFAHAALGERKRARYWALRCLQTNWRERRGYLGLAVSFELLRRDTVLRFAKARGSGI